MITIEVYHDPDGYHSGRQGCCRARLKGRHGIHAAGPTESVAISDLIATAATHGVTCQGGWRVERIGRTTREEVGR